MNIIGDAFNPFEFTPSIIEQAAVDGGVEGYEGARAAAAASLAAYTIGDAQKQAGFLANRLAAFVASKGFAATDSVGGLCAQKKLDLGTSCSGFGFAVCVLRGRYRCIVPTCI
jgi:hypothetical protein